MNDVLQLDRSITGENRKNMIENFLSNGGFLFFKRRSLYGIGCVLSVIDFGNDLTEIVNYRTRCHLSLFLCLYSARQFFPLFGLLK